jgi:large repetitive protein
MKYIAAPLFLLSSLSLAAGCLVDDGSDDVDLAAEALRTCSGWHKGRGHDNHHHKKHKHHHHGKGGRSGQGGNGGQGGGAGGTMGGGGSGGDPRCADMPGIASWWQADGDYDDAIGVNDGFSAGAVAFAPGVNGSAFALNGGPLSYVEVPNDASLQVSNAITIDAWVNTPVTGGRIVDKITAFSGDGYLLDLVGLNLRMLVGWSGAVSTDPIPTGGFVHVAGVFDGTKVALYVNGAPAGEQPLVGTIPINNLSLRIGADSTGGSLLAGVVDGPRIFDRALSASEISQIFWQGTNCE